MIIYRILVIEKVYLLNLCMSTLKNNYIIYFEPQDVEAENPEEAMRKVKYITTTINRVVVVDKNGLPKI